MSQINSTNFRNIAIFEIECLFHAQFIVMFCSSEQNLSISLVKVTKSGSEPKIQAAAAALFYILQNQSLHESSEHMPYKMSVLYSN